MCSLNGEQENTAQESKDIEENWNETNVKKKKKKKKHVKKESMMWEIEIVMFFSIKRHKRELTTHPHLVASLRISGVTTPTSPYDIVTLDGEKLCSGRSRYQQTSLLFYPK